MDRRTFLKTSAVFPAAAAASAFPLSARAVATPWSNGTTWNRYELTTRVEVVNSLGAARVWLPLPLASDTDYFRTVNSSWTGNANTMRVLHDPKYGTALFYAEWSQRVADPHVELTSTFMTRDRASDLSSPGKAQGVERAVLERYLQPTELIPTDGIVRKTALEAIRGARTELSQARAIYEWVVENTFRDPKVRGCGWGDVKSMLETGNLGGKCGDINAVFVGLCRAAGIPARDVYGIRADASKWGYRALGASGEVTRAQHCRAEFYLSTHGWVPVDPADVRKVVLEEPPGKLPLAHEKVKLAREKLFGAWEMNWMAMNYAHDVKLPNGKSSPIPYLMYPNAETASGRKDSLDPEHFRYQIRSRSLNA